MSENGSITADVPSARLSPEFKEIHVSNVVVDGARLRTIDLSNSATMEKIKELAESIKINGLINPISVVRKSSEFHLVCGRCRLEAHKLLLETLPEFKLIRVMDFGEADPDLVATYEIDENLCRSELSSDEIDEHRQKRAAMIARRSEAAVRKSERDAEEAEKKHLKREETSAKAAETRRANAEALRRETAAREEEAKRVADQKAAEKATQEARTAAAKAAADRKAAEAKAAAEAAQADLKAKEAEAKITAEAAKVAERERKTASKAASRSEAKVCDKSVPVDTEMSQGSKSNDHPKELTQQEKLDEVRRVLEKESDRTVVSKDISIRQALGNPNLGVFDRYEDGQKVAESLLKTCLYSRRALQALGNMSVADRNLVISKVKAGKKFSAEGDGKSAVLSEDLPKPATSPKPRAVKPPRPKKSSPVRTALVAEKLSTPSSAPEPPPIPEPDAVEVLVSHPDIEQDKIDGYGRSAGFDLAGELDPNQPIKAITHWSDEELLAEVRRRYAAKGFSVDVVPIRNAGKLAS